MKDVITKETLKFERGKLGYSNKSPRLPELRRGDFSLQLAQESLETGLLVYDLFKIFMFVYIAFIMPLFFIWQSF